MKKPLNRMDKIEIPEAEAPARMPDHCPMCGNVETVICSERVSNNRTIINRRCEKCQANFNAGA